MEKRGNLSITKRNGSRETCGAHFSVHSWGSQVKKKRKVLKGFGSQKIIGVT